MGKLWARHMLKPDLRKPETLDQGELRAKVVAIGILRKQPHGFSFLMHKTEDIKINELKKEYKKECLIPSFNSPLVM